MYVYADLVLPERADPHGAPRNHRKISQMLALAMDGSGHYAPGTRKCSVCQVFKTKKDFNAEESSKPASKRCCYECGAASGLLPSDLAKLTVVKLKEELRKRGLETTGPKNALVSSRLRLQEHSRPHVHSRGVCCVSRCTDAPVGREARFSRGAWL